MPIAQHPSHAPFASWLRPLALVMALGLGVCGGVQAQQAPLTPPPGTVMGAYGQSLHAPGQAASQPAAKTDAKTDAKGEAKADNNDPISRFLQERGLMPSLPDNKLLDQVRDSASEMVMSAMNFLGVPYKLGGKSIENGFDCSGFTRHIFEKTVGLVLPHRAEEQARLSSLIPIKRSDLKPGDLVFFNTMRRTFSHVGIYVGDGKFIHAPRTGSAVRVEDMREAYWASRFTGARRADLEKLETAETRLR